MKNVKMDIKTSFFDVMLDVQKDLEDVSAGIGQIKNNLIYKNFDVKVGEVARLN
jgi:hypothetical protein